jgi:hypothetical protein
MPGELESEIFDERSLMDRENDLPAMTLGERPEQGRELGNMDFVHALHRIVDHESREFFLDRQVEKQEQRFIFVYFAVFGAGVLYILRLMAHTPQLDEPDIEKDKPVRAAGVMPGLALELVEGRRHSCREEREPWTTSPSSGPA